MRRSVFLLLFAALLWSCNHAPQKQLENIAMRLNSHKSVDFKAIEKFVYIGQQDTMTTHYHVWLMRDLSDTSLGGYARVYDKYRPYILIHNKLGGMYVLYPTKKRVRFYPHTDPVLITEGDWINYFFHPMDLISNSQSFNRFVVKDTNINHKRFILLNTLSVSGKTHTDVTYVIDPKTAFPIMSRTVVRQPEHSYIDQMYFNDIRFQAIDTARFNQQLHDYCQRYPVLNFAQGSVPDLLSHMLDIGEPAPPIKGSFYRTGLPFDFNKYLGKYVILLDFWYTHCPYCVMAIPYLGKLYDQEKDRGFIAFGINSVDNKPGMTDAVLSLCKHRGMTYQPIRTTQTTDCNYKVLGYPTMYLIDRNGRIAYKDIGFSLAKYKRLKHAVDSLLSMN